MAGEHKISIWGGARVGKGVEYSDSYSFPLFHLQATAETVTVRIAWMKYTLRKDEVLAIRRCNLRVLAFGHKLGEGKLIQIVHTHPKCPAFLTFSGLSGRDATLEGLKQLGYNVPEETVTESVNDL